KSPGTILPYMTFEFARRSLIPRGVITSRVSYCTVPISISRHLKCTHPTAFIFDSYKVGVHHLCCYVKFFPASLSSTNFLSCMTSNGACANNDIRDGNR